jgi:hypothetical protein
MNRGERLVNKSVADLEQRLSAAEKRFRDRDLAHAGITSSAPLPRDLVVVELRDLTKLGTALGRSYFAYEGGRELRTDLQLLPIQVNDLLAANQVLIHSQRQVAETIEEIPGKNEFAPVKRRRVPGDVVDVHWRATIVEVGSFAAALAKEQADDARARPRPQPVQLDRLHGPAGRDMIGWLERKGITLKIERGDLLAITDRGGMMPAYRDLVHEWTPLLTGWLSGKPVACYRCEQEAVTLLEPAATPACAEHAAG